jgi:hypothetical protein
LGRFSLVTARPVYFATLTVVVVAGAVAILAAGLAGVLRLSWPILPDSFSLS